VKFGVVKLDFSSSVAQGEVHLLFQARSERHCRDSEPASAGFGGHGLRIALNKDDVPNGLRSVLFAKLGEVTSWRITKS
jgi:hypothetical protein